LRDCDELGCTPTPTEQNLGSAMSERRLEILDDNPELQLPYLSFILDLVNEKEGGICKQESFISSLIQLLIRSPCASFHSI
jgi:hypothetical protein